MTEKEKLEKLKKLADAMYYAAQYLTTDASRLHKAMDEYRKFIIYECKEESASEELEEASKEWLRPQLDKSYANYGEAKMMELTHFDGYAMLDAIEFGAKWQKAKDESTTEDLGDYINELSKQFPEVSFAKLSRIAVRVAKWQKQQDQSTIELAEDHAMLAGMEKMKEEMMKNAIDATICLPYVNDDGGYTHLVDVSRPLPVGDNKIAIIFKNE